METGESVISEIAAVSVDPTFTKITEGPVVTDQEGSVNFSWGDYDSDGFLDLHVVNSSFDSEPMVKNLMYHNLGDGTFSKITNATTTTLSRCF